MTVCLFVVITVECREQITTLLTDLGCTQVEVSTHTLGTCISLFHRIVQFITRYNGVHNNAILCTYNSIMQCNAV